MRSSLLIAEASAGNSRALAVILESARPVVYGWAATRLRDPDDAEDIIDEALSFFRAQCLFKNYEVHGPADKTLIYLTCFIQKCLEVI